MFDKPTLIVSIAFFLSGGLIVAGLGYPSYVRWKEAAEVSRTPVVDSPVLAIQPSESLPSVSVEDRPRKEEREDENEWEDEDGDDARSVSSTVSSPTPAAEPRPISQPITASPGALILSVSEVAKHASAASCWVIINGKVYDMTTHINGHSGGAQEILSSCGKDGSVAFNTKGGKGRHSSSATSFLASFYIGEINGPKVK
jgi:cytochrome b involved in lipid metabolism